MLFCAIFCYFGVVGHTRTTIFFSKNSNLLSSQAISLIQIGTMQNPTGNTIETEIDASESHIGSLGHYDEDSSEVVINVNVSEHADDETNSNTASCLREGVADDLCESGSIVSDLALIWQTRSHTTPHKISSFSVVVNTLQSTMGAGILSHASCFKYAGVTPALTVLISVALAVGVSVKLLLETVLLLRSLPEEMRPMGKGETKKLLPKENKDTDAVRENNAARLLDEQFCSFEEVGEAAFGMAGRRGVQVTYVAMSMVAITSFLVPLKAFLHIVLSQFSWFDSVKEYAPPEVCLLAALVLVMLPLSALRSVGKLCFTSLLGMAGLTAFVATSVAMTVQYEVDGANSSTLHCLDAPASEETPTAEVEWGAASFAQTLVVVSIFSCSFVCQLSLFPIFREVRVAEGDVKATQKVFRCTVLSLCIVTLLYAAAGLSGYVMWTNVSDKASSILACYDASEIGILLVYIGMCLCLMFAYPLVLVSCRETVHRMVFDTNNRDASLRQHIGSTLMLAVPSISVGLVVRTLSAVLGIGGAFAAPPLTFLIPPACYIMVHRYVRRLVETAEVNIKLSERLYTVAWTLLSVGVLVQVACIAGAFVALV